MYHMEHDVTPQVQPGYALVPVKGAGNGTDRRDWTYAVPVYDPNSDVERYWSLVMRWPRRGAIGFLYLTQTWRHASVLLAVLAVLYLVLTH